MSSMCTHPYIAVHLSCPTVSSSLRRVLTSFILPVHNHDTSLAIFRVRPYGKNSCQLPALILRTFTTDPNTPITAPFGGRFLYYNHYSFSLLLGYVAFNGSRECRISFLGKDHMEYSYQLLLLFLYLLFQAAYPHT